ARAGQDLNDVTGGGAADEQSGLAGATWCGLQHRGAYRQGLAGARDAAVAVINGEGDLVWTGLHGNEIEVGALARRDDGARYIVDLPSERRCVPVRGIGKGAVEGERLTGHGARGPIDPQVGG